MNRRDEKLDKYIGSNVNITFFDDDVRTGILFWQDKFDSDNPIKPFSYYLLLNDGSTLSFRKTHVKKLDPIPMKKSEYIIWKCETMDEIKARHPNWTFKQIMNYYYKLEVFMVDLGKIIEEYCHDNPILNAMKCAT